MLRLAVIGDPIEHSKSPEIHGEILTRMGVSHVYERVRVKAGELGKFIDYARENKLDGFNLTMPHKVDILPYLDEISHDANILKSVNTVKIVNGKLHGFNTDGDGYIMALQEIGYNVLDKNIVILGAGGVVRTLAATVIMNGAKSVKILNRTPEKAKSICDDILKYTKADLTFGVNDVRNISKCLKDADILINATPLGMEGFPKDYEDLGFFEFLKKGALVSDLIYNPEKTTFLSHAENRGFIISNGMRMLINQAEIADKIWNS